MKFKPSTLDRVIGIFSPRAELSRVRARAAVTMFRKYEGASKKKRMSSWFAPNSSANAETEQSLETVRARARDLERNDPFAQRGISVIASNTVGTGIQPNFDVDEENKKLVKKRDLLFQKWNQWAETTIIDADGRLDFYGMQSLIMSSVARDGEILFRRRWRRKSDGLPIALQIQIIEADYLDHTKNETLKDGNRIVQGVEFDRLGRRAAYHIFEEHPGDYRSVKHGSKRIDASEIKPVYWGAGRAGQVRGMSWFAPVIVKLRDLSDYMDAALLRQKISACFAVFVVDTDEGTGTGLDSNESSLPSRVEPGTIERMGPGKDIKFASPPTFNDTEFVRTHLQSVAVALGITAEQLTGDYSRVNFSSARMSFLEAHRNLEKWRWHMLIPQFCQIVFDWFIEAALLEGLDAEGIECGWTSPRREMIDPTAETNSSIFGIRGGLTSWSAAQRERGEDPKRVAKQIAADNAMFDKLGITLDTDPRKTSKVGFAQSTDALESLAGIPRPKKDDDGGASS